MFGEPRHAWLSTLIHIDSVANARESVRELNAKWREFEKYPADLERSYRRLLIKSAVLAMNRCGAMQKKRDLGGRERRELGQVRSTYSAWLRTHRLGKN
jgi:hypothetical protein